MCHQAYSKVGVKFPLPLLAEIRNKLAPYITTHFTLKSVKFCWLKWNRPVSGNILDSAYSFWYQGRKIKMAKEPETWIKRAKIRSRLHEARRNRYDTDIYSWSGVSRLPSKSMKRIRHFRAAVHLIILNEELKISDTNHTLVMTIFSPVCMKNQQIFQVSWDDSSSSFFAQHIWDQLYSD